MHWVHRDEGISASEGLSKCVGSAIETGCDALMIDPVMNPTLEFLEFKLGTDLLTAKDDYSMKYIQYWRSKQS